MYAYTRLQRFTQREAKINSVFVAARTTVHACPRLSRHADLAPREARACSYVSATDESRSQCLAPPLP